MRPIAWANTVLLRIGRTIAWIALALMVLIILIQVFFRYVLDNALPWPDEAARFLMLWMTGLIAPSAYRWGGFVAIDTLKDVLSERVGSILTLLLLLMGGAVLVFALQFGWKHTFGFGGNFDSSSLKVPLSLVGGETFAVKLRYMYGSLLLAIVLLLAINVELILRTLFGIFDPEADLPSDDRPGMLVVEAE